VRDKSGYQIINFLKYNYLMKTSNCQRRKSTGKLLTDFASPKMKKLLSQSSSPFEKFTSVQFSKFVHSTKYNNLLVKKIKFN